MKIITKMNLKTPEGEIIPRGTVFDDSEVEIPQCLLDELEDTRYIEILSMEAAELAKVAPKEPKIPPAKSTTVVRRKKG